MNARHLMLAAATVVAAACATTRPSSELAEARGIHQRLTSSGADRRVEADLLRTNTAIVEAEAAFTARNDQDDVEALITWALSYTYSGCGATCVNSNKIGLTRNRAFSPPMGNACTGCLRTVLRPA